MIKLYKSEIFDGERDSDASKRLIRLAAKELCGVSEPQVLLSDTGKPYFKDLPIKFSASHSGKAVILAVSDREVGADIQQIKPDAVRIAPRFFTASECEYVGDDVMRFFEIWTKKEAYAKWCGEGLVSSRHVDVTNLEFYTEVYGEYVIAVYEK